MRRRRIKPVPLTVRLQKDAAWHEAKLEEGKILSDGSFVSWEAVPVAARYRLRHFNRMFPHLVPEVRKDRREWRRAERLKTAAQQDHDQQDQQDQAEASRGIVSIAMVSPPRETAKDHDDHNDQQQ